MRYEKFNFTQGDRVALKRALRKTDIEKYYVCARSTTNRLCLIWGWLESRKIRNGRAMAVGETSKISGAMTLYGIRGANLGLRGAGECLQRA